jgi:hypothetical protein
MKWREAWRFLNSSAAASGRASEVDKGRARKAQAVLRPDKDHPERCYVYNGTLNLIARGVAPTDKNILEEAKKIAKATEVHFAAQAERRAARKVEADALPAGDDAA